MFRLKHECIARIPPGHVFVFDGSWGCGFCLYGAAWKSKQEQWGAEGDRGGVTHAMGQGPGELKDNVIAAGCVVAFMK